MRDGETPIDFCETSKGETPCQRPGERPCISMSARVRLAMRTYRYMLMRAAVGDFREPTCTCIPAYSGGDNGRLVAVDGAMRDPACFGAMGEPWAQPGAQDCGDEADPMRRVVDSYAARNLLKVMTLGLVAAR